MTSQEQILQYCLENCIFDGWTNKLLRNACKSAGLDKNYWKIPFPGGVLDVIDLYTTQANERMAIGLDLSKMRVPEKIRTLIKNRLEQHEGDKEIIKSCIAVYNLHPTHGLQASYRTVDAIWRAAGDTATDWNFYSKRALLAGVYGTTMSYWLSDESEEHKKTWEFLDDRLGNVAEIGKLKGKVMGIFSKQKS